jgi:hypothetical protein
MQGALREQSKLALCKDIAQAAAARLELCAERDSREQAARIQNLESRNAELQQVLASLAALRTAERTAWHVQQAELKQARDHDHAATVHALQDTHVEQLATQLVERVLAQAQCSGLQSSLRCAIDKLAVIQSALDAALSVSSKSGNAGDGTAGHQEALLPVCVTCVRLLLLLAQSCGRV